MRPAIIGGEPAFPEHLQFARPLTPPLELVMERVRPSYEMAWLTNGPLVRELEERAADRLGVPHVVAVSSCTAGLMLVIQALAPQGDVVLPSFTFSASAHAVAWNGLVPRFAECDPLGFQLDVDDARRRREGAGAILATHVFGTPAPVEAIEALGRELGVPVVFDAAHGFGAERAGRPVGGYGDAEVFSLSPTKLVVAGEGGLVATRDGELAETLRRGRDYGNPGDYNTRFPGLNARLSEMHAAMALVSFDHLDEHLATRRRLAARYVKGAADLPGVEPQHVEPHDRSTYKDLTLSFDPSRFGLDRNQVAVALREDGIDTRPYFWPPVHRQAAYAHLPSVDLPVTDDAAGRVLSLPMFADLADDDVDRVVEVLAALHEHAEAVNEALSVVVDPRVG